MQKYVSKKSKFFIKALSLSLFISCINPGAYSGIPCMVDKDDVSKAFLGLASRAIGEKQALSEKEKKSLEALAAQRGREAQALKTLTDICPVDDQGIPHISPPADRLQGFLAAQIAYRDAKIEATLTEENLRYARLSQGRLEPKLEFFAAADRMVAAWRLLAALDTSQQEAYGGYSLNPMTLLSCMGRASPAGTIVLDPHSFLTGLSRMAASWNSQWGPRPNETNIRAKLRDFFTEVGDQIQIGREMVKWLEDFLDWFPECEKEMRALETEYMKTMKEQEQVLDALMQPKIAHSLAVLSTAGDALNQLGLLAFPGGGFFTVQPLDSDRVIPTVRELFLKKIQAISSQLQDITSTYEVAKKITRFFEEVINDLQRNGRMT